MSHKNLVNQISTPVVIFVVSLVCAACGSTPAFVGPAPEGQKLATLAFRSQPPAEIYDVTTDGVALNGLDKQFTILPGTHIVTGKFETRERDCQKSARETCTGKYHFGDCIGTFVSEQGRDYTAAISPLGKGAELSIIDLGSNTEVGSGKCTVKGSSFSAVVR